MRDYFYWSLINNYEWLQGLDARFGLYKVDFRTLERRGNWYVIAKDSLLLPCPESCIWALRYRVTEAIKALFA